MSRVIWAVETERESGNWRVSSIHYTRAAARRRKGRDFKKGFKVRVRKYVPFDQYDRILRQLEDRVATALGNVRATEDSNVATTTSSFAAEVSEVSSAGVLAGTQI